MTIVLSVTWLARFFHRTGGLYGSRGDRATAEEGIQSQLEIQRARHGPIESEGPYRREVSVSHALTLSGRPVTLNGRIDGLKVSDSETLIEEYKTTRQDPNVTHERHGSEHWAQVALYAGLLAQESTASSFRLRLTYVHPDSLSATDRERLLSRDQAGAILWDTLRRLDHWLDLQARHEHARDQGLVALRFPYRTPRRFQRAISLRCHRTIAARETLLIEAPTGAGKTIGVLYPAVRALQREDYRRVIFLTSRTTGALAALDALSRLNGVGAHLRYVQLRARETVCIVNGSPCVAEHCERAAQYYDRMHVALEALLAQGAMTADCIDSVALQYGICGHELALDAAAWSDVIVGDYHYVFDPVGHLQRAAPDSETIVIVDEAHQLVARVRDMLHCELSRSVLQSALDEQPPAGVARRLKSLDRQLATLLKNLPDSGRSIARPAAFLRALERFRDDAEVKERALTAWPRTQALVFLAYRWLLIDSEQEPDRWLWRVERSATHPKDLLISCDCLDPSVEIRARLTAAGAHVRCSGTVSPLALTQAMHGFSGAPADRAGGPFERSQLAVLHIHDVPTYWRSRDQSLPQLVTVVHDLVSSKPGAYLAAFPSFDYLNLFADACRKNFSSRLPGVQILAQRPGMDAGDQQVFIKALSMESDTRLGLIVLGGVFAESVDFSHIGLAGVVCVGPGIAPPTPLSEAIAAYHDARGQNGQHIAYLQPALVKTVQTAGRLLRSPESRGVLLLVDPRFGDRSYAAFYPELWSVERLAARELRGRLANFWRETPAPPRLRGSEEEPPHD